VSQEVGENQEVNEVNQEEEQEESQEPLSRPNIAQLVEKAIKDGKQQERFILTLEEWKRPGSAFSDWGVIILLYGEIEKVELENKYEYPTTSSVTYAIIPKTKKVVLLHESGDDYDGHLQRYTTLYVFSYPQGWKSLDIP